MSKRGVWAWVVGALAVWWLLAFGLGQKERGAGERTTPSNTPSVSVSAPATDPKPSRPIDGLLGWPAKLAEPPGPDFVPVWRSIETLREGFLLLASGVQERREPGWQGLFARLVSCLPPRGTRAVVLNVEGEIVYRVRVVSGPDTGCSGYVEKDFLH